MFSFSCLPSQFWINWWNLVSGPEILWDWLAPTILCSPNAQYLSYCSGIAYFSVCLLPGYWLQKGREPVLSATVSWAQCLSQHRSSINLSEGGAALGARSWITGPRSLLSILQSLISTSLCLWKSSHITLISPRFRWFPVVLAPLSVLGTWPTLSSTCRSEC